MKSHIVSYNGLFNHCFENDLRVRRIEIPIIQRDYAQGRTDEKTKRVRDKFLQVLYEALTSEKNVNLDFIYGDLVNDTLRPLDGQQRLTTLFLLHWYLAWRAGKLDQAQTCMSFEYATRPGARNFCKELVKSIPPIIKEDLSSIQPAKAPSLRDWFEDQYWFLHTWKHDPTIQGMLNMIEAIHTLFTKNSENDEENKDDKDYYIALWNRLIDPICPAISFHLLPINQMNLSEDLYIKMNSRGKPLTNFENFKAYFEQLIEKTCPDRVEEYARKIDGVWADTLWRIRGDDNTIDDEFLGYFRFVSSICDWRKRAPLNRIESLETIAERIYGGEDATANLDFLIRCLDTWNDVKIDVFFSEIFSHNSAPIDNSVNANSRLPLFLKSSIDLFTEACRAKEQRSERHEGLGWQQTFLLYAVLLYRLHATEDFPRRVRILRNLIEASNAEIRADKIHLLLKDVETLILKGDIESVSTFNQAQRDDEVRKIEFLKQSPHLTNTLFYLEDHELLRGCIFAFELDASVFEHRARAFYDLFNTKDVLPLVTGALLAAGNYARGSHRRYSTLGSSKSKKVNLWREEILTGARRDQHINIREALSRLLDVLAQRQGEVYATLKIFIDTWVKDVEIKKDLNGLDWRWYFVKYSEMRDGDSGIYASVGGGLGYDVCMLNKQIMSSHYQDPYLSAIVKRSGVPNGTIKGEVTPPDRTDVPWFTGYETDARWMLINQTGAAMRCLQDGFELRAPTTEAYKEVFKEVCSAHGIRDDLRIIIPQETFEGRRLDTEDRVQIGAALLRDLVNAFATIKIDP